MPSTQLLRLATLSRRLQDGDSRGEDTDDETLEFNPMASWKEEIHNAVAELRRCLATALI